MRKQKKSMNGNRCVIISGSPNIYIPFIESGTYIICADRGYTEAKKRGLKPNLIIGDFDSLCDELPNDIETIFLPPEKDDTDTMTSVKKAISLGFKYIEIFGATGGRIDHTYANIQTMAYVKKNSDSEIWITDKENTMTMLFNEEKRFRRTKKYISCFAFSESVIVSNNGLKYPLENALIENSFPLGVSNEFINDECTIKAEKGMLLVLMSDEQ